MKYAMYLPNMLEFANARLLGELAREAEAAGWDGFFIWDEIHSVDPTNVWPGCDPWVALAAIAMQTERIRIGTMVTPVARRRPWKLAQETVTLDHLSGGRLTLGVGLGSAPESDFEKLGEDPDLSVRAEKLDEGLAVIAGLWSGEAFSFSGKHYQMRDTTFLPRPVQSPRIPIWVGAWSRNKAPLRRAARWDGIFPVHPGWPDELLGPQDYEDIVSYIGEHRETDAPFDVVATTNWAGDRPGNRPDIFAAYKKAGVTWWLQEANSLEGARKSIHAGLPRG